MSLPVEVDASEHYEVSATDDVPTHLSVVIDTNPRAWAALSSGTNPITIDQAVANLLIFINSHIAYNIANQITVLAAHPGRHVFLYPPEDELHVKPSDGDVVMQDAGGRAPGTAAPSANKLDQFSQIESAVRKALISLMTSTSPEDVSTPTSLLSGALMRALARINKAKVLLNDTSTNPSDSSASKGQSTVAIRGRIFVLSVSDSDPQQYYAVHSTANGAKNKDIPIDALCLSGKPTLLQQAVAIADGSFIEVPAGGAHGLLAYLMHGFAGDSGARSMFVHPSNGAVDFRGTCLCHSKFVDLGFVCSNCLSVFCEPPADATCLACEAKLALGSYGGKPALIPRRKKKRKRPANADGGSGAATPRIG